MKVTVIDSIMGTGKTTYAIKMMNEDKDHNYVYITPYLDEVKRIRENVTTKDFYEPMHLGKGKQENFHKLLSQEKNIASTHSLFGISNETTRELIRTGNYILILDEVMDVVEKVDISTNDIEMLLKTEISVEPNGKIKWINPEYSGKFDELKIMIEEETVVFVNGVILMWNFPVSVFESFKEIYILTYMFDAQIQRYYYDMHGVEYNYVSTNGKELLEYKIDSNMKISLNIVVDDKLNAIGDKEFSLSSSWFDKDKNEELFVKLKNNVYNFFNNLQKSPSKQNMWTAFKKARPRLTGKGYQKGFVPINSRATNEYRTKTTLAYVSNIFLNPIVKSYFVQASVRVDEEGYALSELLQWIWRSAIRERQEVVVYVPSKRMRELLLNWKKSIEGESKNAENKQG